MEACMQTHRLVPGGLGQSEGTAAPGGRGDCEQFVAGRLAFTFKLVTSNMSNIFDIFRGLF